MRQIKITKQVTNRNDSSLDKYLHDISRILMVTPEEEVELSRRIRNGDADALERLVNANLRFVVSVAKQYQNQGIGLADLINEGNMGLMKAAQRFDETKGFKFISYAVWWIRQAILQAISEQARLVRIPMNKIGSINKINRAVSKLEQTYEREPTNYEIAEELDLDTEDIEKLDRGSGRHVSLDAPLSQQDDGGTLYDIMTTNDDPVPDRKLISESLKQDIAASLVSLSPREASIIKMYYGLGNEEAKTLTEIGDTFGLTQERVRQVKDKAIKRLRSTRNVKKLKNYL